MRGETVRLGSQALLMARALRRAREQAAKANATAREARKALLVAMGRASRAVFPDGSVLIRVKARHKSRWSREFTSTSLVNERPRRSAPASKRRKRA